MSSKDRSIVSRRCAFCDNPTEWRSVEGRLTGSCGVEVNNRDFCDWDCYMMYTKKLVIPQVVRNTSNNFYRCPYCGFVDTYLTIRSHLRSCWVRMSSTPLKDDGESYGL